jgi:hypothetical protein
MCTGKNHRIRLCSSIKKVYSINRKRTVSGIRLTTHDCVIQTSKNINFLSYSNSLIPLHHKIFICFKPLYFIYRNKFRIKSTFPELLWVSRSNFISSLQTVCIRNSVSFSHSYIIHSVVINISPLFIKKLSVRLFHLLTILI